MKKRIIAVLLAVVFVLCLVPATAFAITIIDNGYTFDTVTGELTVTTNAGFTKWNATNMIRYKEDVTSLTVGGEVDVIDAYMFNSYTGITSLTLGDSVEIIDNYAFAGCTALKSLTMGAGLQKINNYAFAGCSVLGSVAIPNNVKTIGASAFSGCTGLTSLTIGAGVETIGDNAFLECTGLTTITIPDSVKIIGGYAFRECTGLTSLTIGDGVETIGTNAFYNCTALKSVTIPDNVKTISADAFLGCTGITSLTIGDGVKTIGGSAFAVCTGITSLTLGDGVESIEMQAFMYCSGLTSLTIGAGVKSIGQAAFVYCTGLETVTIPDSVETIGAWAFDSCTSLRKIISEAMTAPTIGSEAFNKIPADAVLYIPGGATGYDAEGWPKKVVKLWTVSGTVFDENGSPVEDATVTLASDDGYITVETDADGSYSIPMAARNGDISVMADKGNLFGFADFTVSDADVTGLNITLKELEKPAISGPTAMTLTEGYAATSSEKFTITGNPRPSVFATGNDSITWNDSTQCLDIAAGLPIGTYEVTLTAYNEFEEKALDDSKVTALNVPAPEMEPATHVFTLTVKAPDPVIVEYTLTFETNGGSGIDSVTMEENSVVDLSFYKTTRSGYTFSGWYSDEALKNKVTNVTLTADTTVYAGWDKAETPDIPETGDFFSGILLPMTALALLLGVAIAMLKVRMLSLKSRAR